MTTTVIMSKTATMPKRIAATFLGASMVALGHTGPVATDVSAIHLRRRMEATGGNSNSMNRALNNLHLQMGSRPGTTPTTRQSMADLLRKPTGTRVRGRRQSMRGHEGGEDEWYRLEHQEIHGTSDTSDGMIEAGEKPVGVDHILRRNMPTRFSSIRDIVDPEREGATLSLSTNSGSSVGSGPAAAAPVESPRNRRRFASLSGAGARARAVLASVAARRRRPRHVEVAASPPTTTEQAEPKETERFSSTVSHVTGAI